MREGQGDGEGQGKGYRESMNMRGGKESEKKRSKR